MLYKKFLFCAWIFLVSTFSLSAEYYSLILDPTVCDDTTDPLLKSETKEEVKKNIEQYGFYGILWSDLPQQILNPVVGHDTLSHNMPNVCYLDSNHFFIKPGNKKKYPYFLFYIRKTQGKYVLVGVWIKNAKLMQLYTLDESKLSPRYPIQTKSEISKFLNEIKNDSTGKISSLIKNYREVVSSAKKALGSDFQQLALNKQLQNLDEKKFNGIYLGYRLKVFYGLQG